MGSQNEQAVTVSNESLKGDLVVPENARAIILFAHGSGSSRNSSRNQSVARFLNDAGFATMLVDLLTQTEKEEDIQTNRLRFDIELLATRFVGVTNWLENKTRIKDLKVGYFGSSTGTAAALIAAARLESKIKAIVSRSGRPDMADSTLVKQVTAATLLIVGSKDIPTLTVNQKAIRTLSRAKGKKLIIIPSGGHLFEEPGTLEEVAKYSISWFEQYL